nr:hypothetical protein [Tanacetum cinerariifolium]
MLAPGNYVKWKSRIKRYINTKSNHELIHHCLKTPPYKFTWADKEIPISEGSPDTRTESQMETYKTVSQDIRDQLNAKAKAVQIILTGIDNDIYSTVDACSNACEMWKAIERSQQAATRNKGKAIVNSPQPIYDQEPSMVAEDDETSKDKEIDKFMALISLSIGNVAGDRETVGSTVVKDATYHREKMLLCKQEEAGIQLNAEQADWRDDTDDELEDQELEAHYMYMAQLQEVSLDAADSGPIFDAEPLQMVSNNDHYNVFAIKSEHPEQSESVHDTYPIEQDTHNVIIDSLDMSYDREEIDQNDDDNDLANKRKLLASLIEKLKCEIDESKFRNKFLETSNKVLIEKLKGEIEDFKHKNKSVESSNNRFKEANNKLSETNNLLYTDFKKSQAELARRNSMEYASKETYKNILQEIRYQLNAEAEAVQIILTGIDNDIYLTVDACLNACEMWKAIERLKQGESINIQDLKTNLYWEFGIFTYQDVLASTTTIMAKHQNEVNEIRAEKIARVANLLALVAQQQPVYNPQNHPTHYTQNSSTISQQAATRNRGKAIVSPDAADSGPIFDDEPLQKVSNDDHYNVFAMESKHPEQSESVHNTYPIDQDAHNVIIDSLDMSYDREEINQNDDDNDLVNEQAELARCNSMVYASQMEIECAKVRGDFLSYKMDSQKSSNKYIQKINDLNLTILEMKDKLSAYQEIISILSQQKEAQIKLYKTREDKELDKVIALENKVKVLDNIVYKTGQSVQTMNMFNNKCRTSFAKPQFLKKAQRVNPRLYDIGVIPTTSVSRPQLKSNPMGDSVMHNNHQRKKQDVEDNHRSVKFFKNKMFVTACNDSLNAKTLNVNSVCATCDTCVLNDKHDMRVLNSVAKPLKKTVDSESNQKPRNITRKLYECISKTCSWYPKFTPSGHKWKLKSDKENLVEIILFIIDSGCSKHMTGNLKLLINFVEKSKDETSEVLIDFLKLVQRGIQAQVRIVRTNKGTEILNQTLHAYFAAEGILHQTSIARTLNKMALSKDETEHLDGENIDKMKKKSDACIFVGYSTQSSAYRVFNKRTRVIMESIHVNFDELPHMASDHVSSDPAPECQRMALEHDSLSPSIQRQQNVPQADRTVTTSNELDLLFSPIRDSSPNIRCSNIEQNGVVERRNRTLVEAARIMLSAAKVPLFFCAEVIATACFTQNCSLVIPRHEKTPYDIINDRKPSVKFFHIFGSLVRDGENIDKMKKKGDACIFVRYSTQSSAYRVFNKRTRVFMEFIHVNFDELPHMASDHVSSDPAPECQRMALEHDSLSPSIQRQQNVPQADRTVTMSNELDLLFSPMFDELLNGYSKVVVSLWITYNNGRSSDLANFLERERV